MIAAAGISVAKVALFKDASSIAFNNISFIAVIFMVIAYGVAKKSKLGTLGMIALGTIVGIVLKIAGV